MDHEALAALLRTYSPACAAEVENHQRMLQLVEHADPFARSFYEPGHFTASAFIVDPSGRLLLHHHRRLDRWLQMGGHIDQGETPLDAALREAREESGLNDLQADGGILDLDVHWIPPAKGEPGHFHHDIRYLVRTASPDSIAIQEAESIELAWFELDEAERRMASAECSRTVAKIRERLGA